jgi:SnoaL-like domain
MIDAQEIAKRYIASWNEADAATRRGLVEGPWTEDGCYADPVMKADGQDGIAALIGGVHAQFPGYRFALTGQPDGHGAHVRFSWSLGLADGPVIARGTGFAAVAARKIRISARSQPHSACHASMSECGCAVNEVRERAESPGAHANVGLEFLAIGLWFG